MIPPDHATQPYTIELSLDPEIGDLIGRDSGSAGIPDTENSKKPAPQIQDLALQYAEEIRQLTVVATPAPPRRGRRRLFWALGAVSAVLVAALLTSALMRTESDAARAARSEEADLCQQRQVAIMRAINKYTRDRGQPPPDLQALQPRYLSAPAVDPTSGLPYRYTHQRDIISVSCPDHQFSLPAPHS